MNINYYISIKNNSLLPRSFGWEYRENDCFEDFFHFMIESGEFSETTKGFKFYGTYTIFYSKDLKEILKFIVIIKEKSNLQYFLYYISSFPLLH